MESIRLSTELDGAESSAAAGELPAGGVPEDYDGPVLLPFQDGPIRYLSLNEIPEHLRQYAIPSTDRTDPTNQS